MTFSGCLKRNFVQIFLEWAAYLGIMGAFFFFHCKQIDYEIKSFKYVVGGCGFGSLHP